MKINFRLIVAALLLIGFHRVSAQQVDKVIDKGIYKSYYSMQLEEPLYVTYKLFKGGGPCDRKVEGFNFSTCGDQTASSSDYTNSGFEKGHLANAEDFAGSCAIEKKTFCYCNCVPQTRALNHGQWLQWETKIRRLSQTKPLFIVAGSIFGHRVIKPGRRAAVPESCYKIVIDPANNQTLFCLIFPNDDSGSGREIPLADLKQMLGYPLLAESRLHLQ